MAGRFLKLAQIGISGIAVAAIAFWLTLTALDYFSAPPCPAGEMLTLAKPYTHHEGRAYLVKGPNFGEITDTDEFPRRSPVVVCEDKSALGPGHSLIMDIAQAGAGRYVHYMGAIFFSASDNSDPNTNGRQYSIVLPK
jgi:hypothetical protein